MADQQPPQLPLPGGSSWEPDQMGHVLIDAPPIPGATRAVAVVAAACQAGWIVVFLGSAVAAARGVDVCVDLVDLVHAELRRRRGDGSHDATPLLLVLDYGVVAALPRWAAAVPLQQLVEIARVGRAYRVLLALQADRAIPSTLRANFTTRLAAGHGWPPTPRGPR
jgi:hypothetical protein